MPAKKTATGTSKAGRSRVTTALRKATGVVAKATGRGSGSSTGSAKKAPATKSAATKTASTTVAAKKSAAKKSATKKTVAKKAPAKKAPAKKAAPTKATAKKTAAKKATAKKATVKKTAPAKKATAKKTAVKKTAPAKKAVATKSTARKTTPAKKTVAKKAAPAKKSTTTKTTTHKTPAKKAVTHKTAPPQTPAKKTTAPTAAKKTTTPRLRVRDDESPWTAKELAAVRAELEGDVERLTHELSGFEDDIAGLIKDSGDGAGDDQADTGAKTFEREHEASLAQNSRDLLEQSVHALERIDDGTYGVCENCGNAIGKLRLQAFPRATLCLNCKAQQERR